MAAWIPFRDELGGRAKALAGAMAERLDHAWDELMAAAPSLGHVDRATGLPVVTVAATLLSLFPLLQACGGDPTRYRRLRVHALAGLAARYPRSELLVVEAESATITPSGHERTETLYEIDQTTSLALASWAIRRLGDRPGHRSWEEITQVAAMLRTAATGYWTRP